MNKLFFGFIFSISTLLVIVAVTIWAHHFLSVHHAIVSDNFLMEGWVPAYEVEEAVNLIKQNDKLHVYVVGQNYMQHDKSFSKLQLIDPGKPLTLLANGSITIFPDKSISDTIPNSFPMAFILKGSGANHVFSHVSISVNGRFINSFFIDNKMKEYIVNINLEEKLEWISISFDNDLYAKKEDRNFFLYHISIGNNQLDLTNAGISISNVFTIRTTGFSSSAEHMANYIMDLGIDKTKVHVINFNNHERNQTLNGAIAFKNVDDSLQLTSFNVISSGIHSRRTWKTYQHVFKGKANVGVFYFKPIGYNEINWYKRPKGYFQLYNELISYIVNEFYSFTGS